MDTCQEPLRKNSQVDNGVIVSRSEPDPCPESPYGITLIFTSHFLWGVTSGMCTAAGFLNYGSVCVHACDTLLMIMMMYMIPGCPFLIGEVLQGIFSWCVRWEKSWGSGWFCMIICSEAVVPGLTSCFGEHTVCEKCSSLLWVFVPVCVFVPCVQGQESSDC